MTVSRLSVIDVSAAFGDLTDPTDPTNRIRPEQEALSALRSIAAPSVSVIRLYAQAMQTAGPSDADADAESLHQLRVASRRLRALLWAYTPLLDATRRAQADAQLKALADVAGHTRDWDVLLAQLPGKRGTPSALRKRAKRLARAAQAERNTALHTSRGALLSFAVDQTLSLLTSPAGDHPDGIAVAALAARALPRAAAQVTKRARRVFKLAKAAKAAKAATKGAPSKTSGKASGLHANRLSRHDDSRSAPSLAEGLLLSLHRTRVAIKKLRYLSDLFAPVLDLSPKKLARQSTALAALQTRLGKVNDPRASADMVEREWIALRRTTDAPRPKRALAKALRRHLRRAAERRALRAVKALGRARHRKVLSKKYWRTAFAATPTATPTATPPATPTAVAPVHGTAVRAPDAPIELARL